MRVVAAGLSLALMLVSGPALAQTPAGQRDCSQQNSGSASPSAAKAPDGTEKPEQQGVERSAIVPSVGGNDQSASPTVQQNGKDVVANEDCPKPPNQPGPAPK